MNWLKTNFLGSHQQLLSSPFISLHVLSGDVLSEAKKFHPYSGQWKNKVCDRYSKLSYQPKANFDVKILFGKITHR